MSKKTLAKRAAELLKRNSNLKYYEAMEQARKDIKENNLKRGSSPQRDKLPT